MKKIIFLCTGNTCRSPMAEFIAKDIFKKNNMEYEVISRGISVFSQMPPAQNAVNALKEFEIDMESHKSKMITNVDIEESDYIFTMTQGHKDMVLDMMDDNKDKVYMLSEFAIKDKKDILDPFGSNFETYKKSAKEIKDYIEKATLRLKNEAMEDKS